MSTILQIETPAHFNFTQNLHYLSRSPDECMYHILDGGIKRALQLEGQTIIIELREAASDKPALEVRFLCGNDTAQLQAAVSRYVREWLDLDTDLQPFYDCAVREPLLQHAVASFPGLRIMGIPDLFEALCWGIIGQQINLPFAYTLKRRLVEQFGEGIAYEGRQYLLFPDPAIIAGLSVGQLTSLQLTGRKSEYLIGVASLIAEGELSKEQLLASGSLQAAERMLLRIRGIGPWTANYVLMRCLRFPNAFPIDDVGLHNAIKHLKGMERKPTKQEITELAAAWSSWEAYATFYLWRLLY
ncbi:DNA-3-methyladenine glycosylase family protein [Paenibacillus sp. GCM10027626]|uniref:DNA-3-methyladenine glycosylase family protein n=1 Tax=Paenibacillus sp. GCM10027626 TaxID=3273411 RepID=UPI003633A4BA